MILGFLFLAALNVCQGARSEARPLIAVFGMSAASKQNGKLIDRSGEWGREEKAVGCVCVHAYGHACVI